MRSYQSWPFLAAPDHPLISALWEVFAHGTLGMLVVLPLAWRSSKRPQILAAAFLGALALDLDHAAAAASLEPKAMESLARRPPTHSLLLVASLALLALGITRSRAIAWGVVAVLASHLLFDAAGSGVRWLFPLSDPESIPWLACPVGILVLAGVSLFASCREGKPEPGSPLPSPVDSNPVDEHLGRKLGRRVW